MRTARLIAGHVCVVDQYGWNTRQCLVTSMKHMLAENKYDEILSRKSQNSLKDRIDHFNTLVKDNRLFQKPNCYYILITFNERVTCACSYVFVHMLHYLGVCMRITIKQSYMHTVQQMHMQKVVTRHVEAKKVCSH